MADSALVTGPNLATLGTRDLSLVSPPPRDVRGGRFCQAGVIDDPLPVGGLPLRLAQQAESENPGVRGGPRRGRVGQSRWTLRIRFACLADAERTAIAWRDSAIGHGVKTAGVAETVVRKRSTRGALPVPSLSPPIQVTGLQMSCKSCRQPRPPTTRRLGCYSMMAKKADLFVTSLAVRGVMSGRTPLCQRGEGHGHQSRACHHFYQAV